MTKTIEPVDRNPPAASHATLLAFPPVGKKDVEGSPVNEVQDRPQYSTNVHVFWHPFSAAPLVAKKRRIVREIR